MQYARETIVKEYGIFECWEQTDAWGMETMAAVS